MPKFPYQPPDISDSVIDPLPVRALKAAGRGFAKLTGRDDSESGAIADAMPMAGPVAPLISIYKDKAAREAATEAFRRAGAEVGGGEFSPLAKAARWVAETYPRVAAHVKLTHVNNLGEDIQGIERATGGRRVEGMAMIPEGKITEPVPVGMSTDAIGDSVPKAKGVLLHEVTHVGQGLGNSSAKSLYAIGDYLRGYDNNPLEILPRAKQAFAEATSDARFDPPVRDGLPDMYRPQSEKFPEGFHSNVEQFLNMPSGPARKVLAQIIKDQGENRYRSNYNAIDELKNVALGSMRGQQETNIALDNLFSRPGQMIRDLPREQGTALAADMLKNILKARGKW